MNAAVRPPVFAPAGWSVALHLAIAGLLFIGLSLPDQEPAEMILPIDAVVVDQAVLEAAGSVRREEERRVAEERRREETAAEEQRVETERVEVERRIEEERRVEAERFTQEKAKADAKAAVERKRATEAARQKAASEADLRARLEEEELRTGAASQGLKANYVRAIQAHVERRWFEPPGMGKGASCTVHVMQIPGGEVVGVRFGECNGGEAMRQSIETAVRNSSPLPPPPEPALFDREIRLVFTPKEVKR